MSLYISVRYGYPWVRLSRLTVVPDKWVRPIRRLANLTVGPMDMICGPENLHDNSTRRLSPIRDLACIARRWSCRQTVRRL
jgi:hypothetical protein